MRNIIGEREKVVTIIFLYKKRFVIRQTNSIKIRIMKRNECRHDRIR